MMVMMMVAVMNIVRMMLMMMVTIRTGGRMVFVEGGVATFADLNFPAAFNTRLTPEQQQVLHNHLVPICTRSICNRYFMSCIQHQAYTKRATGYLLRSYHLVPICTQSATGISCNAFNTRLAPEKHIYFTPKHQHAN